METSPLLAQSKLHFDKGEIREAVECAREELKQNPTSLDARAALIMCYGLVGEMTNLITLLRETTEVYPSALPFTSSYLFCLNYFNASPDFILSEHIRLMKRAEGFILNPTRPQQASISERKIRIGYVSGDFRVHACAHLTLPLLGHHDHSHFDIFLYSNNPDNDDLTEIFKQLGHWRDIRHLSDTRAARQIQEDGIDILVDLSGHTVGGRVSLFMHRPAPIQISWYGYLNTLGTEAIDYRFTDPFLAPPEIDRYYVEKLIRLPRAFLYEYPENIPPVAPPPYIKKGYFTFGAIHNIKKLHDVTLDLWCEVLKKVPSSKVILNTEMGGDIQKVLTSRFLKRGIPAEQLVFEQDRGLPHYFDFFGEYDLGLDTFPYTSGVSAMHGIWMGAPTLTIEGVTELGRNCSAVNRSRGLDEFVTQSPEDFIARAVHHAQNPSLMKRFRETCRSRPVVRNEEVVRAVETVYKNLLSGTVEI